MAQEFLENIYKQSLLISDFEDSVHFLREGNKFDAQKLYNSAISSVESIIKELSGNDRELAEALLTSARTISENWEDSSYASALITSSLIPLMYKYMSYFTDIDVTENEFRIKSSDSGFLTITDLQNQVTYHDTHNPLNEASEVAESFYAPTNREVHLFGCDMGYLPYMLHKKSDGAIKIVIYESDSRIVNYAREFGILDWIPESDIEFVLIQDLTLLLKEYLDFINSHDQEIDNGEVSTYISPWKAIQYHNVGIDALQKQVEIDVFNKSIHRRCVINMMRNYSKQRISFDKIRSRLSSDECIIVAAGPSLDDSMSFIKDSSGSRTVIAVNTVIKRLYSEKAVPDVVVAADARPQLIEHIYGYEEFTDKIPLIADETTCWKYIDAYQGDICLVPTPNGKGLPLSNPDNLDVWQIYGTVVTLAIEVGIRLGAKKFYLAGLDLAYPGGVSYAHGVAHERVENKQGNCSVESVDGTMVETSQVFDLFRRTIEEQISVHPDLEFINLSKHGALIHGTSSL
ncbi:DUF115 domain-containing protein [Butyrivibrio sp. CB08]|uniref:6-hydroxymethylpterin diphosphokinase MptE-like protein n=1 Tax=Butyrivibrio sp. CB08 TaxID=2364879 RepID=UPI000EA9B9E8|nr:6-hydroxymethylpterin diphosphokinase MptE-like protein [Butyrivibrio sp. CB08]RKM60399.1 DUF115 domain-containing protein [Butyrivibrio sp. CB08]